MEKISKDKIKKLYDLANIETSDIEIENFSKTVNQIANDVEKIKTIDTEGLTPSFYCVDTMISYIREDDDIENIEKESVIKNAPETDGDYITIAKVVE